MMEHIQSRAKEELLNMDDCMFEDFEEKFFVNFTTQKPKVRKHRNSCKNLVAITSRQTKKYLDTQNTKERLKNNLKEILQTEILSQTPTLSRVSAITGMKTTKHSNTTSKIPTYCYNEKTSQLTDLQRLPIFSLLKQNNSSMVKKITPLDAKEPKKNNIFEQQNSQIRKFIKKKMQQKALEKQQRMLPLTSTIQNINKFKTLINEKIKTQQNVQQITLKKRRNSNGRTSTKRLKQKVRENAKIQNKQNQFVSPEDNLGRKQKQGAQQSRKLRSILF